MWVAITLNDFGQVHLMRDEPDQANAYLYAVLNHATPFYSWCEERGQFPAQNRFRATFSICGRPRLWCGLCAICW